MTSHVTNTPLSKKPYRGSSEKRFRTYQVFLDADCRFMLPGLLALCADNKIDVTEMDVGNLIVFVNTSRTMIKVLACNGSTEPVLGVYRIPLSYPHGSQFDLSVVAEIPKAFGYNGSLDVAAAMKAALLKKMGMH